MDSIPFESAASRMNGDGDSEKLVIGALCGGGKLGYITVLMAERFTQLSGRPFHENFNQLHGISIGAFNSASLWPVESTGKPVKTPAELREGYDGTADLLFLKRRGSWGGTRSPKFRAKNIRELYNGTFDDLNLSDFADGLHIYACEYKTRRILCFSSEEAKQDRSKDFRMSNFLLAASALPGAFPQHAIQAADGTEYQLTDGGIYSPDPSFKALRCAKGLNDDDIVMITFGTGIEDSGQDLSHLNDGIKGVVMGLIDTNRTVAVLEDRDSVAERLGLRHIVLDINITGIEVGITSPLGVISPIAEQAVIENEDRIQAVLDHIARLPGGKIENILRLNGRSSPTAHTNTQADGGTKDHEGLDAQ